MSEPEKPSAIESAPEEEVVMVVAGRKVTKGREWVQEVLDLKGIQNMEDPR